MASLPARGLLLLGATLVPSAACSDDLVRAGARLLDVSPERLAACEAAFRELVRPQPAEFLPGPQLVIESRHERRLPTTLEPGPDDPHATGGTLLLPDESLFIEGREDDYRRAAERWLERSLKAEELAPSRQPREGRPSWRASPGWASGPTCTVGAGPWSVRVAEAGEWRLRWSRKSRLLGGPWKSSAWVGEEDGDVEVGFSFGRSLLASRLNR